MENNNIQKNGAGFVKFIGFIFWLLAVGLVLLTFNDDFLTEDTFLFYGMAAVCAVIGWVLKKIGNR